MEYSIGAAIIAGIVATAVMTAIMYMGLAVMPRQMPLNILYMMGTMMTRNTGVAYMMGFVGHFGMGIVLAIIHTLLYQALGLQSGLLLWGLLFGAVHWAVASMGMGMIGTMHPMIRNGEMTAPGAFVKNLPMMTVMGFLVLHLLFGLIVGVLYEALA